MVEWYEATMHRLIGSCSFVRFDEQTEEPRMTGYQLEPVVASFSIMECRLLRLVCLAVSQVAGLLVGVDMPDHVVG